jgi:hypothetical protein
MDRPPDYGGGGVTWRTPYLTDDEADAIADGLHDEAIERMAEREEDE